MKRITILEVHKHRIYKVAYMLFKKWKKNIPNHCLQFIIEREANSAKNNSLKDFFAANILVPYFSGKSLTNKEQTADACTEFIHNINANIYSEEDNMYND